MWLLVCSYDGCGEVMGSVVVVLVGWLCSCGNCGNGDNGDVVEDVDVLVSEVDVDDAADAAVDDGVLRVDISW